MNVLYFTSVSLGNVGNGGSICCRNHVQRLSEESGLRVFALVIGHEREREGTDVFLDSLAVPHQFVPLKPREDKSYTLGARINRLLGNLKRIFSTPWEMAARRETHVKKALDEAIQAWGIQALVIDYSSSAFFIQLPRKDIKTCIIKLNRETDFHIEHIMQGGSIRRAFSLGLRVLRIAWMERKIDRSVGKVIVIGPPDLPRYWTQSPPVCISPYLDRKPARWNYTNSQSVFFVGSITHYPNEDAISWIATRLAPELLKLRPEIRIRIFGCTSEAVPQKWRSPNIDFLGGGSREEVERFFREVDLMLCPIRNDFGMKFKAAEALAFGIPLLASRQTLLGLPYLTNQPAIDLQNPHETAVLISELVGNEKKLVELSASQERQYTEFTLSQSDVWTKVLSDIPLIRA
jgi:glycosyltransferase involved in cell wall biosynthesis